MTSSMHNQDLITTFFNIFRNNQQQATTMQNFSFLGYIVQKITGYCKFAVCFQDGGFRTPPKIGLRIVLSLRKVREPNDPRKMLLSKQFLKHNIAKKLKIMKLYVPAVLGFSNRYTVYRYLRKNLCFFLQMTTSNLIY